MDNNFNQMIKPFDAETKYCRYSPNMLMAVYNGRLYSLFVSGTDYILYSFEPIDETSRKQVIDDIYCTTVPFEGIEDIVCYYLYARYHGNVYKVLNVKKNFDKVTLATSEECGVNISPGEDGFTYSQDLGEVTKKVDKKDIEQFLCVEESVYQKYLDIHSRGR